MNDTNIKKNKKTQEKIILDKKNNKSENKRPKKPSFFTMADYFYNTSGFSRFYKSLS